jgi:hypothetical protein
MVDTDVSAPELYQAWSALSLDERIEGFELLRREEAQEFFRNLSPSDQAGLILTLFGSHSLTGSDDHESSVPGS